MPSGAHCCCSASSCSSGFWQPAAPSNPTAIHTGSLSCGENCCTYCCANTNQFIGPLIFYSFIETCSSPSPGEFRGIDISASGNRIVISEKLCAIVNMTGLLTRPQVGKAKTQRTGASTFLAGKNKQLAAASADFFRFDRSFPSTDRRGDYNDWHVVIYQWSVFQFAGR